MDLEDTNQPSVSMGDSSQKQSSPSENQPIQSKKLIILLGIIIALFAFGVGGYFLGANKNQTTPQSQQITVSPTISQPSPTNTPISVESSTTASWKTYTSEKNKFSIKYPSSWTEKGPVADSDNAIVYLNAGETFGEGPEPIRYYVWIYSDNKLPNAKLTKETVGEYTVYKTDELPSRSGALSAFITKDEKTYISVSITPYDAKQPFPSQDKYVDIFNQMLSTFRLTD